MSVFDRMFRRGVKGHAQPVALDDVTHALSAALRSSEPPPVDRELISARLADRLRDAGLQPVAPERWLEWTAPLDEPSWQRLGLLADLLDAEPLRAALASSPLAQNADAMVRRSFVELPSRLLLLELEILREGPQRVEELARAWLLSLALPIAGETPEQSSERLQRLDYARLLAESERAQGRAEQRKTELERLQEEQARKLSPRGKW